MLPRVTGVSGDGVEQSGAEWRVKLGTVGSRMLQSQRRHDPCDSDSAGSALTSSRSNRWLAREVAARVPPPRRFVLVPVASLMALVAVAMSAPIAIAATWTSQPMPPVSGHLSGVSCPTVTTCIAVGVVRHRGAPPRTLAEIWNGSSWAVQSIPSPANGGALDAVSCTSATACTAVGDRGFFDGPYTTLAEHWNGHSWRIQATPNPVGPPPYANRDDALYAVDCSSASSCTAVGGADLRPAGASSSTLAEHWNGATWTVQPTLSFQPANTRDGNFWGVSCASPSACVAVGSDGAERWDGRAWSRSLNTHRQSLQLGLNAVSCASADACMAVGIVAGTARLASERWNGHTWDLQTIGRPGLYSEILGVSCASARSCVAVGFVPFGGHVLIEHWAGGRWAPALVPTVQNPTPRSTFHVSLLGVSCISTQDCTAVGGWNQPGRGEPLAERSG